MIMTLKKNQHKSNILLWTSSRSKACAF